MGSEDAPATSTFSSHTQENIFTAKTIWNDMKNDDESKGFSVNPEVVTFYGDSGGVLFYPALAVGSEDLRNTFDMQRRRRPMVPAPTSCPMPDKQRSGERRDRLYLLYLQPWVLESSWALPGIVPHICWLNEVKDQTCEESICLYSYSEAWKKYISQNIVSRHAHRIIVQFMAANCGKVPTLRTSSLMPTLHGIMRKTCLITPCPCSVCMVSSIVCEWSDNTYIFF